MTMKPIPRGPLLGAAMALGLAVPALAATPALAAGPVATPAPAITSGQPPAAGTAIATPPPNAGQAQVAQAGGRDQESADEGPGQQHVGHGPDNETEDGQSD